jgi:hypothetical protein
MLTSNRFRACFYFLLIACNIEIQKIRKWTNLNFKLQEMEDDGKIGEDQTYIYDEKPKHYKQENEEKCQKYVDSEKEFLGILIYLHQEFLRLRMQNIGCGCREYKRHALSDRIKPCHGE